MCVQVSEHSSWSIGFYSRIFEAALSAAGAPAGPLPPLLLCYSTHMPSHLPTLVYLGASWCVCRCRSTFLGASASTAASKQQWQQQALPCIVLCQSCHLLTLAGCIMACVQVSEHSSWSIGFYSRIVEAALAAAGAPQAVPCLLSC
jgi:hypothetical protein